MPSARRSLRVGLLTTLGTNIGDDFIREGLVAVMESLASKRTFDFIPVNKHKPATVYPWWLLLRLAYTKKMKPRRGWKFLREAIESHPNLSRFGDCDFIVQCGTPVLWEGCGISEWSDLIWRKVLAPLAAGGIPILNLGGGSSYPYERPPATLLGSPDEAFARQMAEASTVLTTRDELAAQLFTQFGKPNQHLCCPALLASAVHVAPVTPTRKVVVNYMRRGGHYDYGQNISPEVWRETMGRMISHLTTQGWEISFLAHNRTEAELAAREWPSLPCLWPETTSAYFHYLKDAHFGIFNRLHAAVAAAGMGIPSVAVGTDTRLRMVETLGLPAFYVKDATFERLRPVVEKLIANRSSEAERLLALRSETFASYQSIFLPFVEGAVSPPEV